MGMFVRVWWLVRFFARWLLGIRDGLWVRNSDLHLLLHHLLIHPWVKGSHQRRTGHAVGHRHVMQWCVVDLMQVGYRLGSNAPHQDQRTQAEKRVEHLAAE